MPGMNIRANTTSVTRGNAVSHTLIQQQVFAKKKTQKTALTEKSSLRFRNGGVKHVAYYPTLKASVPFDDSFSLKVIHAHSYSLFSNSFTVNLPEDLFSCRTGNRNFLMGIGTRIGLFLWSSMRVGLIVTFASHRKQGAAKFQELFGDHFFVSKEILKCAIDGI